MVKGDERIREVSKPIAEKIVGQHLSDIKKEINKCYSPARYEVFQEAVQKITLEYLRSRLGIAAFLWLLSLVGAVVVGFFLSKIG